MRSVSRFEANLLQILRSLIGRTPLAPTVPLVVRSVERPACLGRDCVELVQQTLSLGVMDVLARQDGWPRLRHLHNGEIAEGRLWGRTEPEKLALQFSINTMEFLIWITAESPTSSTWKPHKLQAPTLGDEFLFFLAFGTLRKTEIGKNWCGQVLFQQNALCGLMYPDDFAERGVQPNPQFDRWLDGAGAGILESFQSKLAERWVEMEQAKSRLVSAEKMRRLGSTQAYVLQAFLDRVDLAQRRDLARFLLDACGRLLRGSPHADQWTGVVDVRGLRMADRTEIYRQAFAFLRQMQRLNQWQEQARRVGFYDEGYAASQLWKADWERFDADGLTESVQAIIRTMEPLQGAASSPQDATE